MVATTPLDCQVCQKHNCKFIIDQMIDSPIYNEKGQLMFIQQQTTTNTESEITSPNETTIPVNFTNLSKDDENGLRINNDADYNAWWVKKYCTETAVNGFIKYFPYILFVVTMVIVAIEKVFTKTFKAGKKLAAFYNLLVKEEGGSSSGVEEITEELEKYDDSTTLDDRKDVIEMSHSFTSQDNFFLSYLVRTIVELLFAIFLLGWLCVYGVPIMYNEELIACNVYGKMYECAGHPQTFFMWILGFTIIILVLYILCCIHNIWWLVLPEYRGLTKMMKRYAEQSQIARKQKKQQIGVKIDEETGNGVGTIHKEDEEEDDNDYEQDNLDTFYFKNPDLKLLLDLLAVSSGVAFSLRILVLFDKNLRLKFQPGPFKFSNLYYHDKDGEINVATKDLGMSVEERKKDVYNVTVTFKEAIAINRMFAKRKDISHIYTVEILPRTARSSITKAINVGKRGWKWALREMRKTGAVKGDITGQDDESEEHSKDDERSLFTNWKVRLYDLEIEKEYTIRTRTIVNGRKIAQRIEKLKAKDVDHECKVYECRRIHMFQE